MKRRKLDLLHETNVEYDTWFAKWIALVQRYEHDAPAQLWRNMWPDQVVPPGLTVTYGRKFTLETPEHVYAFYHLGRVKTHTLVEYPVGEKSKWPWTVVDKPVPQLPKDVWGIVVSLLSIEDAFTVASLSRTVRDYALRNEHWLGRLRQIERLLPHFRELLQPLSPRAPHWKWFAQFRHFCRLPTHPIALRMAIYARIPFEMHLPLGQMITTKRGWITTPLADGEWTRYISFTLANDDAVYVAGSRYRSRFISILRNNRPLEDITPAQLVRWLASFCRWTPRTMAQYLVHYERRFQFNQTGRFIP